MKHITIKHPPTKPERKLIEHYIDLYDFKTAQDIVDCCSKLPVPLSSVKIERNGYYAEDMQFVYSVSESDEALKVRMDKYKEDLKKYNEWLKEHEKEIKAKKNADAEKINKVIQKLQDKLKKLGK